ncbi:MAG TPA: VUT family protein, partial [Thermomicrobiales bacterium]|nr:VUT family protein [Thermomicrobiales bacterium]
EGVLYFIGFIASIWFANWLLTHWGTIRFPGGPWLIPVWPGDLTPSGDPIYAPSGVIAIGLSFTLRDLVQRRLGVGVALVAVVIGAALSAALDPTLALASGVAFLLAESLDLFVYTPLQRRNLVGAVVASNVVGLVVDSIVFLSIAFGSLALLEGQVIGKAWMTLVAIPLIYGIREWDSKRGMMPTGVKVQA